MLRTLTAASVLILAATAAHAAPAVTPETASITVDYRDLNLTQPEDARLLSSRLEAAAKEVCSETGTAPSDMKSCTDLAITHAVYAIESQLAEDVRVHLAVNTP